MFLLNPQLHHEYFVPASTKISKGALVLVVIYFLMVCRFNVKDQDVNNSTKNLNTDGGY
jgi:hypothetical protein